MQLHQLQQRHKSKTRKRVGRGGKRGTYSGRGIKGQKARAGRKLQPMMRELIKRYPKLRGYRYSGRSDTGATVNLALLERHFTDGEQVTPVTLLKKGLVGKIKGKIPEIKILADGQITKRLSVEGCVFSKKAKEKIEQAGGKVNLTT